MNEIRNVPPSWYSTENQPCFSFTITTRPVVVFFSSTVSKAVRQAKGSKRTLCPILIIFLFHPPRPVSVTATAHIVSAVGLYTVILRPPIRISSAAGMASRGPGLAAFAGTLLRLPTDLKGLTALVVTHRLPPGSPSSEGL